MRVVLLTVDEPWQRALAERVSSIPGVTLAGIILQESTSSRTLTYLRKAVIRRPAQVANKILQRVFYNYVIEGIERESVQRFGRSGKPLSWPDADITPVRDINAEQAVQSIRSVEPDLI